MADSPIADSSPLVRDRMGPKITALLDSLDAEKRAAIESLASADACERADFLATCDPATRTTLEALLHYLK